MVHDLTSYITNSTNRSTKQRKVNTRNESGHDIITLPPHSIGIKRTIRHGSETWTSATWIDKTLIKLKKNRLIKRGLVKHLLIKQVLSIDPCFTNSCFINPRFINPCFTNPVLLLLIQSNDWYFRKRGSVKTITS